MNQEYNMHTEEITVNYIFTLVDLLGEGLVGDEKESIFICTYVFLYMCCYCTVLMKKYNVDRINLLISRQKIFQAVKSIISDSFYYLIAT